MLGRWPDRYGDYNIAVPLGVDTNNRQIADSKGIVGGEVRV